MKTFILLFSVLCVASSLVASQDELKIQLEALRDTLNALESRAQIGDNAHLWLPRFEFEEINRVFAYFSKFDKQKLNSIQKSFPRIYAAAQAVLETYPNNMVNLKGKRSGSLESRFRENFYEQLAEKYSALRAQTSAAKQGDNFELIKGTKAYDYVKQSVCSSERPEMYQIVKQLNDMIEEYHAKLQCKLDGQYSESSKLEEIEKHAVYFGNFPVAVLRLRIAFINSKIIGRLDEEKNRLLDGLKQAGYTVRC